MRKLRIGVLGCANIARRSVIPAICSLKDQFSLEAIASRSAPKAQQLAEEFGCRWVDGYEELVESDSIDALYIPLPTGLHREWIAKAISHGKHVYAEKSFAMTHQDAQELVEAASTKGIALMEGYMFLYHNQQAMASQLIKEGKLGELRHFHGCFGFPPLPADNFRFDEALGGGVLMDAAGYPVRAASFLLGSALRVESAFVYRHPETSTSLWGSALLSDRNTLSASVAFSFNSYYQCRYEVWGSKGKITLPRAYTAPPDLLATIQLETADGSQQRSVPACNHFVSAFEAFHQAVEVPEMRRTHYRDILLQSKLISDIRSLSTNTGT